MDTLDLVEDDEVIAVSKGHHALIDWRGIHPIPEPTFFEEVRRDPYLTWLNRVNRAKILRKRKMIKEAEKVQKEADAIDKQYGFSKLKEETIKRPRTKIKKK